MPVMMMDDDGDVVCMTVMTTCDQVTPQHA